MICRYRISSYSFRNFMYCDLWHYVLWPLDFQIQKRIVSTETIWGNTVHTLIMVLLTKQQLIKIFVCNIFQKNGQGSIQHLRHAVLIIPIGHLWYILQIITMKSILWNQRNLKLKCDFIMALTPIVEHWVWDSVGGDNPTKKLVFSKTVAAKSDHIFPMVVLLPGTYRLGCKKLSIFCFLYLCLAAHSPLSVRLVS